MEALHILVLRGISPQRVPRIPPCIACIATTRIGVARAHPRAEEAVQSSWFRDRDSYLSSWLRHTCSKCIKSRCQTQFQSPVLIFGQYSKSSGGLERARDRLGRAWTRAREGSERSGGLAARRSRESVERARGSEGSGVRERGLGSPEPHCRMSHIASQFVHAFFESWRREKNRAHIKIGCLRAAGLRLQAGERGGTSPHRKGSSGTQARPA